MSDKMFTKCPACHAGVTVCWVSVSRSGRGNNKRFNGYRFLMKCRCGARVIVDRCSGQHIPPTMKIQAVIEGIGREIRRRSTLHRRRLSSSAAKIALKQSRLINPTPDITTRDFFTVRYHEEPELRFIGEWVVYRMPNGAEILFNPETQQYTLSYDDMLEVFDDLQSLVDWGGVEIAT